MRNPGHALCQHSAFVQPIRTGHCQRQRLLLLLREGQRGKFAPQRDAPKPPVGLDRRAR